MERAPALWRFYGSINGITFTEIPEASNETALTVVSIRFYEKTLNGYFTTPYQYIGITFNRIVGSPGFGGTNHLGISQLQIFGKELNHFPSDWNSTMINKLD